MANERVIREITEEQRKRILTTPGAVVYTRSEPPSDPFFTLKFRPTRKLNITAFDLMGKYALRSQDAVHLSTAL